MITAKIIVTTIITAILAGIIMIRVLVELRFDRAEMLSVTQDNTYKIYLHEGSIVSVVDVSIVVDDDSINSVGTNT